MFYQFSILALVVAVVMAQEDESSESTVTTEATSFPVSVNRAACQTLYPNSTVTLDERNNGCRFYCGTTDNLFSYIDMRTAPDGQACAKEDSSCYKGVCYENQDIEICRRIANDVEFSSISSTVCRVTCSTGVLSSQYENRNDGKECTPFVPVAGSQYECQSGSCVVTTYAFPQIVPPGGSFPQLAPIVFNPSRNPTRNPDPNASP